MSTLNLCFKQKYEKYQSFLSENFQFLEMKFSIYLNRRVFVMKIQRILIISNSKGPEFSVWNNSSLRKKELSIKNINQNKTSTLQPLYSIFRYNMVLDITQFKDGSQKCIDYFEKWPQVIFQYNLYICVWM